MIEELSLVAPKTGVLHTLIKRMQDAGKKTRGAEEAEKERAIQETKKVLYMEDFK